MSWIMWAIVAIHLLGAYANFMTLSKHGQSRSPYNAGVSGLATIISVLIIFGVLISEGVL